MPKSVDGSASGLCWWIALHVIYVELWSLCFIDRLGKCEISTLAHLAFCSLTFCGSYQWRWWGWLMMSETRRQGGGIEHCWAVLVTSVESQPPPWTMQPSRSWFTMRKSSEALLLQKYQKWYTIDALGAIFVSFNILKLSHFWQCWHFCNFWQFRNSCQFWQSWQFFN